MRQNFVKPEIYKTVLPNCLRTQHQRAKHAMLGDRAITQQPCVTLPRTIKSTKYVVADHFIYVLHSTAIKTGFGYTHYNYFLVIPLPRSLSISKVK